MKNNIRIRMTVLIAVLLLIPQFPALRGQVDIENDPELDTRMDEKERERERSGRDFFREQMADLEKAIDPSLYVLGPYDQIQISIFGTESRSFDLIVLPEGNVFLPGIGSVKADGLTIEEFRERVYDVLDEYFHDIEIHSHLLVPRTFKVFVTGAVKEPGAVSVTAVDRVSDAVRKGGGITADGSRRRVKVQRGDTVLTVDLFSVIVSGDMEENLFLSSGDAVHVPPAERMVTVSGPVRRPGTLESIPGESIRDIIRLAGGMRGEAVRDSILLSRAGQAQNFSTFNVTRKNLDMEVRDLDVINVHDRFSSSDRVFVFGAVNNPGRFYISKREKLSDLLARVGGFQNEADLRGASIERRNKEYIRLDLSKYINKSEEIDIRMRDGDKLYVPRVQQVVAVGGEVKTPGSFEYQGYLTVAHYVGLAGGPTERGSMSRIKIYSPDGSVRDADRNTYPTRGDVIIVQKSRTRVIGDFFGGVLNMAAIVVSILVLTR
ncbi:MAG: SLBB domain-containing protein [Candidatus Krumholzibacteriota bacterium]